MNPPMVRFEQLTFRYRADQPPLLADFELGIPAGRTTAILGPNGAGKSTLLFLTLGWLRPMYGRVWLGDCPLEDYTRREKGQFMSLVPQREQLTFAYSVLEYVLLARAPYLAGLAAPAEADYAIAANALHQAGLNGFAHRSILELSGGERQLVLFARALTQQPHLLLLDEPTTHLDLHNKARIRRLLRQLQHQSVTILMTTHEPELALELASHVVLLDQGRLLYAGSVADGLTSERLSRLYQSPVEVRQVAGRRVVLW